MEGNFDPGMKGLFDLAGCLFGLRALDLESWSYMAERWKEGEREKERCFGT